MNMNRGTPLSKAGQEALIAYLKEAGQIPENDSPEAKEAHQRLLKESGMNGVYPTKITPDQANELLSLKLQLQEITDEIPEDQIDEYLRAEKEKATQYNPKIGEIKKGFIEALQEQDELNEEERIKSAPFLGYIVGEKDFSYEVYLVNPSDVAYDRVLELTGEDINMDTSVYLTSRAVHEKGSLAPYSSILIEAGDLRSLDGFVWYHLDLFRDGQEDPDKFYVNLPRYGNREYLLLPVLEKIGKRSELIRREKSERIEEMVKHMDMEAREEKFLDDVAHALVVMARDIHAKRKKR